MGPDTLLNQREIQKIVHVNDLVSQLLRTFRFEERRQLTYDRFNKYPTDVRVRKDLVERVLGPLEEPLDKGTMVQLLKQLGPVGGPHLGVVTLEWMLESGWEEARSVHVFNALLALCDRCCQNKEVAFTVYDMMREHQVQPDLFSYNLLIGVCRIRGEYKKAFEIFEQMNLLGVIPNMFTFTTLIEVCNFRNGGHCAEALYAFRSLLNSGDVVPDYIKNELMSCVENGCAKADLKSALEIFAKLEAVGLSNSIRAYNAVLKACGRSGEWVAALDIFACMKQASTHADTQSYNSIIQACCLGGETERALEVFEWMNEGRGAAGPVPADTTTYNTLIKACNQKGMLEKALEVFTWMQGAGVVANSATYDSLIQTVEDAREWDDSIGLGTPLSGLRPAPFDGMRMLYMEKHVEKALDERLAEIKLGQISWAPCNMRTPSAPPSLSPLPTHSLYDFLDDGKSERTSLPPTRGFGRHTRPTTVSSLSPIAMRPGTMSSGAPGSPGKRGMYDPERDFRRPVTTRSNVSNLGASSSRPYTGNVGWSTAPGHLRRPPPLSAKEIVLAREHGIDSSQFRLAV
mmetsp:Transcript_49259/g.94082  ORF Transcript_49259/g.94082 Transcript_49259/m.94082 type:complete len:573 (+) Transcript_49259:354-2072(+)